MLAGNSPPALTGVVNGSSFTGMTIYTTAYGDSVIVTLSTNTTSGSSVGQYAITAGLSGAKAADYFIDPATSASGTMYVVSIGADPTSTIGAESVVFWDNKGNRSLLTAADLSALVALNLVKDNGNAFDPKSVAELQAWLQKANATSSNMAYQLSMQLAVMDLDVLTGYVKTTDLVYAGGLLPYVTGYGLIGLTSGGFISIANLMASANAALLLDPTTFSGDPFRAYEAALTIALQAADNNSSFVQQEVTWNLTSLYQLLTSLA